MTEQFDDIDKLHVQLEYVQRLHGEALQELQTVEGKLLDKSAYNARRKLITEAHEEASREILRKIEETQTETRKRLALDLRYSGATAQEQADWAESVRLVEGATTIQQQEELIHRAMRWGDKALARALVFKLGGRPEYKAMHELLAGVDDRVRASYEYERKHGNYQKKGTAPSTWAGWTTYTGRGALPDIPGRAPELQPAYIREQKRQAMAQRHAGNK